MNDPVSASSFSVSRSVASLPVRLKLPTTGLISNAPVVVSATTLPVSVNAPASADRFHVLTKVTSWPVSINVPAPPLRK